MDSILIAETDQNVRELQKYFLSSAGFSVEFVDDGEAALEHARLKHPAVIITEILIPKIDGLSLCRRLSSDPVTSDIPVVVFSMLAAEARATEAGARTFLRKPLVGPIFLNTVQTVLATPQTRMEQQWVSK